MAPQVLPAPPTMSENRETSAGRAPILLVMDMDFEACRRAFLTRDPRFDGRIFGAVKTTGIYCRPICPARTPKPQNMTFYPTAAACQEAGYRPCLRCRPESSPDLGAWRGTAATSMRSPLGWAWASVSCGGFSGSIWAHRRWRWPRRAACCSPSS